MLATPSPLEKSSEIRHCVAPYYHLVLAYFYYPMHDLHIDLKYYYFNDTFLGELNQFEKSKTIVVEAIRWAKTELSAIPSR